MLKFGSEAEDTWPTYAEHADRPGATTIDGKGAAFILRPEGNNAVRWSAGERLHHLFEERCDQFEALGNIQHPAIELAEGVLSYGELDRCANQLARYLLSEGLSSGAVVALLFDKSIYCYVSLLAVLKINAAYVPLDPGFPAERISYIVSGLEGETRSRPSRSARAGWEPRTEAHAIRGAHRDRLGAPCRCNQDTINGQQYFVL